MVMENIIANKRNGITNQQTFCEALGIPRAKVPQIRSNFIQIPIHVAISLATEFNVSLDWLFTNIGEMYRK